ncbi:uncharacterized protein LOC117342417 [Pecten maximus]|uniref:uncharacterized protein LOC117342417 n=1 Tax=Pecten maximus TaxID=6579 RepID=UPI00145905AF|nr:uncharacterized protein LOC117342417 [Pecten maximus]
MPRGKGTRRKGSRVALSPPPAKKRGGRRAVTDAGRSEAAVGENSCNSRARGPQSESSLVEIHVEEGVTGCISTEPVPDSSRVQAPVTDSDNACGSVFSPEIEIIPLESDSIGNHVPRALKQKIWGHEYINLALLLKGYSELNEFCTSAPMVVGSSGVIETRPAICKEKITNIEKWTDAFHIFMSIYLERFPHKTQELLQYISTIRGAASQGVSGGWQIYDEQFRARLSQSPGSPWNQINSNLWFRVMTPQAGGMGKNNQAKDYTKDSQVGNYKPSGACHAFNKGNCKWDNCRFAHVCSICADSHSATQCKSFRASAENSRQGKGLTANVQSGKNSNK